MRAFSRKADTSIAPASLKDCLEGALLLVAPRARRQGVILQRPPAGQNYQVLANRIRLEQVLVNLLQNAMEALEGRPDGRIVVALQDLGATVQVYVNDNGPGLSAEARAHLFTPFYTTKTEDWDWGWSSAATSSPNSVATWSPLARRSRLSRSACSWPRSHVHPDVAQGAWPAKRYRATS